MSIKTFIFSQPDKPIVKEKKEIDQTYKKFRFEIIASVFISYAVFYLTRKNFSAAMPAMLTETSLTAEDFAIMSSIFYILYGAMKFVGGMLVDKINPKAMTGPVLIGVGIVNILFRLFRQRGGILRAVQSQRDITGHQLSADGENYGLVVFEKRTGTLVGYR